MNNNDEPSLKAVCDALMEEYVRRADTAQGRVIEFTQSNHITPGRHGWLFIMKLKRYNMVMAQ